MTSERVGPQVAVVVSTRGRSDKIGDLLRSLSAIPNPSVEFVIIDQSVDERTELVVAPFLADSRLRYVRSADSGVSRGRNLGCSLTSAPLICVTDDDCIVPVDWLDQMTAPFRNARVGFVWCSVVALESRRDGHTPQKLFRHDALVGGLSEAFRRAESGFNLGAGMAFRRTAFEHAGRFDHVLGVGSTFPAAEDNDLAWRCLRSGWLVYELSTVQVVHNGFRTLSETRALADRDFRGVGGASAKYVRGGNIAVLRLLVVLTLRLGVVAPLRDALARRRPRGFRRPIAMWRGLFSGLRRPLDRSILRYR